MAALIYLGILVVAFYALVVLPQRRRMMAMRALQSALREGDEIVTTSGIYGRVVRLDDAVADVEVAPATVLRMARGAIAQRIGAEPESSGGGADED
ncbi:MAG: preprotein translocase subunit YajC [Acidimicrobiia bacterium]|nr:preprotein translocase subunit YajC [Acidimicrobiia bacterium]